MESESTCKHLSGCRCIFLTAFFTSVTLLSAWATGLDQTWKISSSSGSQTSVSLTEYTEQGITTKLVHRKEHRTNSGSRMLDSHQHILPFSRISVQYSERNVVTHIHCALDPNGYYRLAEYIRSPRGQSFLARGLLIYLVSFRILPWTESTADPGSLLSRIPDCEVSAEILAEAPGEASLEQVRFPLRTAAGLSMLEADMLGGGASQLARIKIPFLDSQSELGPSAYYVWTLGTPGTHSAITVMALRDRKFFGAEFQTLRDGWVRISLPETDTSPLHQVEASSCSEELSASNSRKIIVDNHHRKQDWIWEITDSSSAKDTVGTMTWHQDNPSVPLKEWSTGRFTFRSTRVSPDEVKETDRSFAPIPEQIVMRRGPDFLVDEMTCIFTALELPSQAPKEPELKRLASRLCFAVLGTGALDVSYPQPKGVESQKGWPIGCQPFPFARDCSIKFVVAEEYVDAVPVTALWGPSATEFHWKRDVVSGRGEFSATYLGIPSGVRPASMPLRHTLLRSCKRYGSTVPPVLLTYAPSFSLGEHLLPIAKENDTTSIHWWHFRRLYPEPGYFCSWYAGITGVSGGKRKQDSPSQRASRPHWTDVLSDEEAIRVRLTLESLQGAKNAWIVRNAREGVGDPGWEDLLPLLGLADRADLPRPRDGFYILGTVNESVRYEITRSRDK